MSGHTMGCSSGSTTRHTASRSLQSPIHACQSGHRQEYGQQRWIMHPTYAPWAASVSTIATCLLTPATVTWFVAADLRILAIHARKLVDVSYEASS